MSVVTETIIQDSTFGNKLDALTAKLNGTNYTPPAADSNSGTTLVEPILTDETFSAKMDTLTGTLVPLATKADTTALELTDKKLRYLSELTKGQVWDTENGTTPAYSHTVTAGAKCVAVNMIGGKTEVVNNALVSADVTGVDSKDSDSVSLGSLAIPQALRTAYPLHSVGSVYDEYDIARKKFVKRVGTVDLGTLTWQRITWTNVPIFLAADVPADAKEYSGASAMPNIICGIYETKTGIALNNASSDKCINLCTGYFSAQGTGGRLTVVDNAYSDAAAFTAAVSGVTLYYELATPTETDISQYISDDNLLTVEAGGTLTFTQNGTALSIPNGTEYAVKLEEATT